MIVPLTRQQGQLQAFKITIPAGDSDPHPRSHSGYEWMYVLSGRLRLVLGHRDLTLAPGDAAEFDTQHPHWFGSTGNDAVEIISLFGQQGERMHVRAHPNTTSRRTGGGPIQTLSPPTPKT